MVVSHLAIGSLVRVEPANDLCFPWIVASKNPQSRSLADLSSRRDFLYIPQ